MSNTYTGISVPNVTTKKPKGGRNPYRKSVPSPADVAAAARLRKIWDDIDANVRPTQEDAIQAFGRDISQSAISQFRNGHVALTFEATLVFAKLLGCLPQDIRDDLPEFRLLEAFDLVPKSYRSSTTSIGARYQDRRDQERAKAKAYKAGWPFEFAPEIWDSLDDEAERKRIEGMVLQMIQTSPHYKPVIKSRKSSGGGSELPDELQ